MKKLDIFFIVFFITLSFTGGFFVSQTEMGEKVSSLIFEKSYKPDQIPNSEQEIIDNCKNLNLIESTFCVRDNIKTFYLYNETKESYSDIETLKQVGGDCLNWAYLYERIFKELNFDTQLVYIEENGIKRHVVPLVSNGLGYCMIDDLIINCGVYRNG